MAVSNGQIKSAATYLELLQDGFSDLLDTSSTKSDENTGILEDKDPNSHPEPNGKPSIKQDDTDAAADDVRATGEWSTYKYYFKSIGLRDGSLFVVMTAFSAFFMSFGSE